MPEDRRPGKLVVILHADIAGSTTLVQQDEHLAHERIQATFRRFSDVIAQYHGRVRELRGDALLAEFERASDAVSATLAFQATQAEYVTQLKDNILPLLRVGIAMGEVVIADNTVTGEGVVLAQRVEQLATPGGVCITGAINEALPTRLPFDQTSLGEQQVKGFDEPVRVYGVALKTGEAIPSPEVAHQQKPSNTLRTSAAVAGIVLIVAGGGALWFQLWAPKEEPASVEHMAFPLPDKPSIAVLPFDNLSASPDQEYLADGLSEEIITVLSKIPNLFVIARNSTFIYKGKAVSVKQVAEEQGVRYVLEGSVQRSGDRIRINAQLIDALEGHHLWAESYDRDFDDIFALQDDITQNIMVALQVELTEGEEMRYLQKSAGSPEAFEYFQKGRAHFQLFNKEDNAIGRQLMAKAVELSPDSPAIWVQLAYFEFNDARFGWSADRGASFKMAMEVAVKAYALEPNDAKANGLLGALSLSDSRHDEALAYARRAVELAPGDAIEMATLAWILCYSGYPEEAIPLLEKAMRLSPYYPAWFAATLGLAYFMTEDYGKATAAHEHLIERKSLLQFAYSRLAGINAVLGKEEKARGYATELLRTQPNFTIESWSKALLYRNPEDLERELSALRAAGLPEKPPLALPDKPSIAVLPFSNMSGDPEQEYFVDGMTEDLITDLSKIAGLFVIARNSSFTYKDQAVDVKDVARYLGVRYVLEGSVRRAGKKVRINAQLIDATTGGHLWAERYDGTLQDVFMLQDKVTEKIIAALAVKLSVEEQASQTSAETNSPQAYDAFLQGWEHFRRGTPDGLKKSIAYLEKATERDPLYSRAYAALAAVYWRIYSNLWYDQVLGVGYSFQAVEKARTYLKEAMKSPTPVAYQVAAEISAHATDMFLFEPIVQAKGAIDMDPNDPAGHLAMAMALLKSGRAEEAEQRVREAMRLDPHYPPYYLVLLAWTQFAMERYPDAAATLERALDRDTENHRTYIYLVATYGHLGRLDDAKIALEKANKLRARAGWGIYSLSSVDDLLWVGDSTLFKEGLQKAGVLPERDWSRFIKTVSMGGAAGASKTVVEGATTIDAEQAKALHDQNVPFIDVSKPWYEEHVPGAHFLMIWFGGDSEFNEVRLARIAERSQPLVIYSSGLERRAVNACAMAVTWGFRHVYYFENGLKKWKAAGYTTAAVN